MEAGIRFSQNLYVKFTLDPNDGIMDVLFELITDDGEKHELTGSVVWDIE